MDRQDTVDYFTYINDKSPPKEYIIPALLGKAQNNNPVWIDISSNPHMIVAGTTGSGKTVALKTIITNIIKYDSADIYLSDPKLIDYIEFDNTNNVNIVHTYEQTIDVLDFLKEEMDNRFSYIRNGIDESCIRPIVFIIDELSDLMFLDKNHNLYIKLCVLAQKCRAAKINIILGTQRPSTKIISGDIKANFPARLSCKVTNSIDSRVILDESGAEKLLGKGDAILKCFNYNKIRLKIAHVDKQSLLKFKNEK